MYLFPNVLNFSKGLSSTLVLSVLVLFPPSASSLSLVTPLRRRLSWLLLRHEEATANISYPN